MDEKFRISDLIVSILIIYFVISYAVQLFCPLDAEVRHLLVIYDFGACIYFLIDWFMRFSRSENRPRFAWRNSLDFIVSLPIVELFHYIGFLKILQIARLVRLFKLFTSLSRVRSAKKLGVAQIMKMLAPLLFVVLMIISPILVLLFERNSGGSIDTAVDAIWWTYCTISTIGYGDLFPITIAGRAVAVVVSVGGIAIFGMISAILVNLILKKVQK